MNKEVFEHRHIVLCSDHYNPLGIIRSLGEEGINPTVLLCCEHPHMLQYSKYIGELHLFKTIEEGFEYMLNHYSAEVKKPFVYDGSDDIALLLDNNYENLKDHFHFCNGKGGLGKYLQKYDICLLAEESGIKIPKEEYLKVGTLPTSLKYPVITKAATSSAGGAWKDQSFVCEDEKSLMDAYSKIKAEYILVQEYIRKKNELCIDGISINGGEQVFMPYGCSYYNIIEGRYSNYMYFTPFKDITLTEKITKVIRGSNYTGIFCIEFLIGQDDELYFLEVNYRNSGWSYAFTHGGFNLPFRWAVSTLDNKLYLDNFTYKDKFDVMQEMDDFRDRVVTRNVSLFKWIKQYRNCGCTYYANPKDPKPFRAFMKSEIKRLIKKFVFRKK